MKSRTKYTIASLLGIMGLNLLFINAGPMNDDKDRATGLLPITAEEKQKLHKKKIKKIRMNARALQRINAERFQNGEDLLPDSTVTNEPELEIEEPAAGADAGSDGSSSAAVAGAAPAQVDNSGLPSFPPIGNQGSLPSCTAWALTYYQMSHEVCLNLGCDNKSLKEKIFSPRWTYNMINSGAAQGTSFSNGYSMMSTHGAATNAEFPYGSDYRSWDMNPEHWRTALNYRMQAMSSLTINSDSGMSSLKQVLANGHVVVLSTYINSWQYRYVQQKPNTSTDPFVGQQIVHYVNGTAGLHAMTIVGYDDNIWTDMNGNGAVDAAELGAFKIANSWGSSWRNSGYIWAAYDAFRTTSAVSGFSPAGRAQLASTGAGYMTTYSAYEPKLLARVTLSHAMRNQIGLRFAQSSSSVQTPSTYFYPFAVANKGGAYAFNGSTTAVDGTFYFDISSLASSAPYDQQFYFLYSDSVSGSPLSVRKFEIIEPSNLITPLFETASLASTVDAGSGQVKLGNYEGPVIDTQAPSAPSNLTYQVTTTSNQKGKKVTLKHTVNLSWGAATDNVGVTKYRVLRNGSKIAEISTRSYSDSSVSAGQTYTYSVQALDAAGNASGMASVKVSLP